MLFEPLKIREMTFRNRIAVSPMCQYSSENGFANDWHLVHLGSRAVGGAGLVMTEAAAIEPIGRISPYDLGIWQDEHIPALKRISEFIHAQGAVAGIQLAHAGRKASTARPWEGGGPVAADSGGWRPVGPSTMAFSDEFPVPEELAAAEVHLLIEEFAQAARRSLEAGFQLIEIHAAHGYLLHEFLSPASNHREDEYGGDFRNRVRFLLEVVQSVRRVWPEGRPLFVRISATDWLEEGGWDLSQSIELAKLLKKAGVDLVDCSSGGLVQGVSIPLGPGYQTDMAAQIRREAQISTGAVGMITSPEQAEHILNTGQADMVFLARELLRDPHWPLHAAGELGVDMDWPSQYARAKK